MLEQMQGLMHLELSGCNDFTEAGLWSSLNARLTSLSVSDCINVADDAIAAISQLLPNLSELSLQAYHVTDTAMAYFTAKQVGLYDSLTQLFNCMLSGLPPCMPTSLTDFNKASESGIRESPRKIPRACGIPSNIVKIILNAMSSLPTLQK